MQLYLNFNDPDNLLRAPSMISSRFGTDSDKMQLTQKPGHYFVFVGLNNECVAGEDDTGPALHEDESIVGGLYYPRLARATCID